MERSRFIVINIQKRIKYAPFGLNKKERVGNKGAGKFVQENGIKN
jgi:hypothetical protein